MKRFFPILLISAFTAVFLLFTGCGSQGEENEVSIKDRMDQNYEQITQASENAETFQVIADSLSSWAKENNLTVKSSGEQYIVLSKAASSGYEDAEDFTFHASVSLDTPEEKSEDLQSVSAVMTALNGARQHGELTGIITFEKEGRPIGASALGKEYLNTDNFISVNDGNSTELINSIAASSNIMASKELDMVSPRYTKAYRIVLDGTPYKSPYEHRGEYPNAIKTIGDLLASCQSSGVLFELASFNGGTDVDLYPRRAEAVIVLQENDVTSFTSRFENSYENVAEYYEDLDESFEYTMTEIALPDRVIADDDTANIVSLMYTIINGTYYRSDDDEVTAFSNIGKISTKNRSFRMQINAKSLENTIMDEMHTVFETTCGLCDVNYSELSTTGLWYVSPETPLIEALSRGMNTEPAGTLENKAASVFLDKKEDLNLVVWNTDIEDAEDNLSVILDYMASFGEENQQ